jgi:hypothetical protein
MKAIIEMAENGYRWRKRRVGVAENIGGISENAMYASISCQRKYSAVAWRAIEEAMKT